MKLESKSDYEAFAVHLELKLTPYADKIIARVKANDGFCPCKSEEERKAHPENDYKCPCSLLSKYIQESGRCCCNLFCK